MKLRPPIEELADDYLARRRGGGCPSITQYAADNPELAEEIWELFPTLVMLEDMGPGREDSLSVGLPANLGEYRIVREIGRGGMGIVLEAEHETLRRRVALKVMPRDIAQGDAPLGRFHREARAAGRLHHTNIVPVFEVGVHDGIHYYAMQYIEGQNLDTVIDEVRQLRAYRTGASTTTRSRGDAAGCVPPPQLGVTLAHELWDEGFRTDRDVKDTFEQSPTEAFSECDASPAVAESLTSTVSMRNEETSSPELADCNSTELSQVGSEHEGYFQRVARIGLQVAEALDYAHRQGILHRDIKPSNLILDTSGVVWVTDFGLAKHHGDDLTHTGDIVGTLRYMAPERLSGKADARSDVYSLGLTLYELCTLTHAINAQDRAQVVHQISQQIPPLPRKIDSQIPRDLETIVLKAIDKSPRARYQSSRQMAEDLRLFLSDRPIQARRTSTPERVWRWCRRNPLQAVLLACVATLLLVVAGGAVAFGVSSRYQAGLLRQRICRTSTAETEAVNRLYESEVAHARASRWSRRPGQHFVSLDAIQRAARILPRLDMSQESLEEQKLALRNEAIAAMSLYDVRERLTIATPAGWTNSVALSPDFQRYALSDEQGRVSVWRVSDGEQLHVLEGPDHRAWILQFSPDGRYLAGKFHKGTPQPTPPVVAVWDLTTGQRVVFEDKDLNWAAFDFSRDSRSFALSSKTGVIRVCSLEEGSVIQEKQASNEPTAVQFNREGTKIALGSRGNPSLAVWDFETDQLTAIPAHAHITSMDWSPNDQLLALGCSDGCIHLLDVQDHGRLKRRLTGHISNVVRMYFNGAGDVLVTRSWDGTTRMWDLTTGTNSLQVDHGGHVVSGFASADDAIGFVNQDRRFGIWEIARGGPLRVLYDQDRTAEKRRSAFHPLVDRLLCVATPDGTELWDVARRILVEVLPSGDTQSAMFSPDGHTLFTCGTKGVLSWPVDLTSSPAVQVQIGIPTQVTEKMAGRAELDVFGRYLAFEHSFARALVLDLQSGESRELKKHLHLNTITISPDGKWVVTATW